ncbi:MAG TPA: diaminopropionate ammonia-lyase [Woeseiaceae bacterium]|nr:diaminopropionate ammonia-lyase [Woeseiaceae bacterium]
MDRVITAHNHLAVPPSVPYPEPLRSIISRESMERARTVMADWPGYSATPLVRLPALAQGLGLGACYLKDEGARWDLKSFKALGGAYAVSEISAAARGPLTVCCATDGNHGRSVAWGARRVAARAVIYLHERVNAYREEAIRQYGAETVRVAGTYDDSVRAAAAAAAENGWVVVSDTSYPGYDEIPRLVMQGYTVLVDEVLAQLPPGERLTHVVLQGGVGGLAAAVTGYLWDVLGPARPEVVVVEPERAACLLASARAGRPEVVHGSLDTLMAGLSCGEVSALAWDILAPGARHFIAIPDERIRPVMRALASGAWGEPVVSGESGAAGVAGLEAAAADPVLRDAIGLDAGSRVLAINTEGDTDPGLYRELVGRSADDVMRTHEKEHEPWKPYR